MNKKILIISIIVFVVLIGGYLVYINLNPMAGSKGQTDQLENDVPQVQIEVGGVGVKPGESGGTLMVCQDKCGDNICQTIDPSCTSMNCPCPETKEDCLQDCK